MEESVYQGILGRLEEQGYDTGRLMTPARGKELMEFSLAGMLVSACKRGLAFNF